MKKPILLIIPLVFISMLILTLIKFGTFHLILTLFTSFLAILLYDILNSYGFNLSIFKNEEKNKKILDMTILKDSRCPDIISTGFLGQHFIIPKILVEELQKDASSTQEKVRNEARKALDIISRLRENEKLKIEIKNPKNPTTNYYDSIINLAKETNAQIITSDYEITKRGLMAGVTVLNINELHLSLKQAFLPGDEISVFILKEGKDKNQGIAYLEDGTMIVIENGYHYIGKKVEVIVQSILKSSTGKIIFTKIK